MLLKSYFEPKVNVGVTKASARAVPPPPSAPKSSAPSAPLPQDSVDAPILTLTNSRSAPQISNISQDNFLESEAPKQDHQASKNSLPPLQSLTKISIPEPSPQQKSLSLNAVDEAIASRKHDHVDTPSSIIRLI